MEGPSAVSTHSRSRSYLLVSSIVRRLLGRELGEHQPDRDQRRTRHCAERCFGPTRRRLPSGPATALGVVPSSEGAGRARRGVQKKRMSRQDRADLATKRQKLCLQVG